MTILIPKPLIILLIVALLILAIVEITLTTLEIIQFVGKKIKSKEKQNDTNR